MKKISMALLMAIAIIGATGCKKVVGVGPTVTETRSTPDFKRIELGIPADLYYTVGPQFKVEISAQRNVLDIIETVVSDNLLRVKFKDARNFYGKENVVVKITAPDIYGAGVNGSGHFHAESINGAFTSLWVNGSGDLDVNKLMGESAEMRISGSGEIKVFSGTVKREDLGISGSGEIEVDSVVAGDVKTNTSGSGDMKVNAIVSLDCKISGSGDVKYKGSPKINTSISGSGRVTPI